MLTTFTPPARGYPVRRSGARRPATPAAPDRLRPLRSAPGVDPGGQARRSGDSLLLHRRARRIVGSDDLAWDVVQETLIRDHRRQGEGRRHAGGHSPLPALLRLCSLIALEVLRARRRREAHEFAACDPSSHTAPRDPAHEAQRAELRGFLLEALEALPYDQRRAFELFEFDGHAYACIAQRLGVAVGTVRSRIARARATLRLALERTAGDYATGVAS